MTEPAAPHLTLAPAVRDVRPSATIAIAERSRELHAQGREVIRLGLGQSPFPVPEIVVDALRGHAREKDYLPARGLPALRDAVAEHLNRRQGLAVRADQVLIGPGSKELLFLLQLCYAGDLVLPAPSWVSYAPQARILGRRTTWLRTEAADGHLVTAERLDALCRTAPGRARLLILNYPGNPTGTSYTAAQLGSLAEVVRRHRVLVLSDEIYGELDFAGAHVSLARFYPEGTIVSGGLSKWCGAGGWRLGTFVVPRPLAPLTDVMAAVASETFTAVSAPIQFAAVRAYQGGPEIDDYLARSRALLGALLDFGWRVLVEAGAEVCPARGGFYLFPSFEGRRDVLRRIGVESGASLCERLLDDTGVACLPGSDFGRPGEELSLRLALVDFDGDAALAGLERRDGTYPVDDADLDRHCARTVRGLRALRDWFKAHA